MSESKSHQVGAGGAILAGSTLALIYVNLTRVSLEADLALALEAAGACLRYNELLS